jgi:hypothetical protein
MPSMPIKHSLSRVVFAIGLSPVQQHLYRPMDFMRQAYKRVIDELKSTTGAGGSIANSPVYNRPKILSIA